MILSGDVGRILADIIFRHRGHDIRCVTYGDADDPDNYAIECEECGEVLVDTSGEFNEHLGPQTGEYLDGTLP